MRAALSPAPRRERARELRPVHAVGGRGAELREREADRLWNAPKHHHQYGKAAAATGSGSTPRDECTFMMQHAVIPGANWGSLGGGRDWAGRCGGLVGGSRVRAAAATHKLPRARDLSPSQNQPLKALAGLLQEVTTWINGLDDLAVFHHHSPSFHRTVSAVLDAWYWATISEIDGGSRRGAEEGRRWFQENIKSHSPRGALS